MRSFQRHATPFLVATTVLCIISGCNKEQTPPVETSSPADRAVQFVKVVRQESPDILELAAKVQADPTRVVHIFPPASGRVTSLSVKPGDRVSRGQTVAFLDSADVATARADYAKAKIEAERSARALDRKKFLFEQGAAPEKDYIDARAQAESANAELVRAQQHLELFHASPSSANDQVALTTPLSGVVLDVAAAPGEFSKSLDNANALVTVANLSSVWIVGDVYERDLAKLRSGVRVTVSVEAYPGRKWHGVIGPLSGALDPLTRTLKVRITVPNSDLTLRPEMFASIQANVGTRNALVVPATAIVHEGNRVMVFIKNGAKPEQHQVTIGRAIGDKVEILDGLKEGDEVAADGAELLTGGAES